MEYNQIESLLEKYFDGETSIEQEKQLTNYFSSDNVAQHLQQYQLMFKYFEKEKQTTFKQKIVLKSNKKIVWLSMAASVILLAGIGAFYLINNKQANSEVGLGTYESPEIAFAETQKALQLLSSNVNVGINSVAYIGEYQNTKNKIFIE
jgi:hypothetical protein